MGSELMHQLSSASIKHHPLIPPGVQKVSSPSPIIPNFYEKRPLEAPDDKTLLIIDVRKLTKFARHPLRFYFHEQLKIFPDRDVERGEYLLSPLTRSMLVKQALKKPLEEVLDEAKEKGLLPVNMFEDFAKQQIKKQWEQYREIDPSELYSIHLRAHAREVYRLENGNWVYPSISLFLKNGREVKIVGTLENISSGGLLVGAKNQLDDLICFWPHLLIMDKLKKGGLFLLKEQESFSLSFPEDALTHYMHYFELSLAYPSPLLPGLAKPLLFGEAKDLEKAIRRVNDEIIAWLLRRDPLPRADVIHENWAPVLRSTFQPLLEGECAKV